jgi:apolipoprotein N-acyltransferase
MQQVLSTPPRVTRERAGRFSGFATRVRSEAPSLAQCGASIVSAVLLVLSFPDFNFWPLAWVALIPLLLLVAQPTNLRRPFILGWLFGTVFFYGSCYWLTYSMIHTGGISAWLAFPLLLPGAVLMGIFPALFGLALGYAIRKWGPIAVLMAPFLWVALEWGRLEITGQLWNAIAYSQAYHPALIQSARWGGVYLVGFLIVAVNAAVSLMVLQRTARTLLIGAAVVLLVGVALLVSSPPASSQDPAKEPAEATVIAIQPNVPMTIIKSPEEVRMLTTRHFETSNTALRFLSNDGTPRLVIWPESPMNFAYGSDVQLRALLASFAKANHTSVLLNSQELAPNDGVYNSALLINQEGNVVTQYDKIRLLPFGEYVPLPQWLPGASLIRAIVGDFTPGTHYRLMPVGTVRAGVFICIESAYPSIARRFAGEGADVLINISNDGYLGPTAVMKQHLANAVFRAVENDRPVLRVTNTGITAFITQRGEVRDATRGFTPEVRIWKIAQSDKTSTFYTKHGDLFPAACAIFSLLILGLSFRRRVRARSNS